MSQSDPKSTGEDEQGAPAATPSVSPRASPDSALDPVLWHQAGRAEALGSPTGEGRSKLWLVIGILGLLGAATLLALDTLMPQAPTARGLDLPAPSGPVEGLRTFEEVERERALAAARRDAGLEDPPLAQLAEPERTTAAVKAPEPSTPSKIARTEGAAVKPAAAGGKKKQGLLTLVTTPDCEVRLGSRVLGRTPMFKLALPEGTHSLVLIGPDRKKRRLNVPIKHDEPISFRLDLDAVPAK